MSGGGGTRHGQALAIARQDGSGGGGAGAMAGAGAEAGSMIRGRRSNRLIAAASET